LVLAGASQIFQANRAVKAGTWRDNLLPGAELHRKTYGIVGLGRIGSRVAEIANAFGMSVVAYDPYAESAQFLNAEAERLALEELLKRADVISFHVPATAETQNMLNRSNLEYINRGVILINTSRGSVISEMDLCEALSQGWIGFAGLDVFEKEPLSRTSRLLSFQNVVLTPHIGAFTNEAFQKASEQAALKLIRFFMDGSTSDTLPPKAAWYGVPAPFQQNKS
jgi:D-3-phosphoglycerate dehydrogenase